MSALIVDLQLLCDIQVAIGAVRFCLHADGVIGSCSADVTRHACRTARLLVGHFGPSSVVGFDGYSAAGNHFLMMNFPVLSQRYDP